MEELLDEALDYKEYFPTGYNISNRADRADLICVPPHGVENFLRPGQGAVQDTTSQKSLTGDTIVADKSISVAASQQDTDLHLLKHLVTSMEAPIKIEYRCPKCRGCAQCRNSVDTEKVSLREEAEDAEICKSVNLDFENRRIFCYLPLRGREEDFLTSNFNSALKIMDKQCQLYAKEPETRDMIVKGMSKLFEQGDAKFLDILPEKLRRKILNKPVNYFIPWRVQFKPNSLSTPARPVFDCSSKTPTRPDGTGGRCLNDAVMKGRTMSLNLVRMVMRFTIGCVGFSGDLKQFYNVFKLTEDQWNLQLFLWRCNMDLKEEVKIAVITTLIYGNKAAAPQTEEGIKQLVAVIGDSNKKLGDVLLNDRFVDDLNSSQASFKEAMKLTQDADEWFAALGMEIKGWCISGQKPPDTISVDGSVGVGGMSWTPEIDTSEVKYAPLHFGSVSRGRTKKGTQIWDDFLNLNGGFATLDRMDKFVPKRQRHGGPFPPNF